MRSDFGAFAEGIGREQSDMKKHLHIHRAKKSVKGKIARRAKRAALGKRKAKRWPGPQNKGVEGQSIDNAVGRNGIIW